VSISATFYALFFCQYPFAKKSQSQTAIREKLGKALFEQKSALKMLMKLTTGVNFIDVFRTRFSYECLFGSFSLVMFGLAPKFRTKKARLKC